MNTINRFLVVVRLPHLNHMVPDRDVLPCINGLYYAGVDRQRWIDVFDEDYFAGHVPSNILNLIGKIRNQASDLTGIDLCQRANDALALLNYSNRRTATNELIAVRAPSLDPIKGTIQCDLQFEWLGYDFVRLGEWSLAMAGVFMHPQNYSRWVELLNSSGLFDDRSLLKTYEQNYEKAVEQDCSEPLAPASAGLETVEMRVGRVSPYSRTQL